MTYIGDAIRVAREAKGLTQKQLSQITGLSRTYISDVETGRCNPSWRVLQLLAISISLDLNGIAIKTDAQKKSPA